MKSTNKMFRALLGGGLTLLLVFALIGQAAAQSWIEVTPPDDPLTTADDPPDGRSLHTAVVNTTTNRMIVFGGSLVTQFVFVSPSVALLNDVWVLSNSDETDASPPAWTQLSPTGTPPSKRGGHSAVYDPATNRMIVFGGNPNIGGSFTTGNEVRVLSNADGTEASVPAWTQLSPDGGPPSPRWLHTAGYHPDTNRMIVFGGTLGVGNTFTDEVWVLENANGMGDTPNWSQLSPTGGPVPVADHTGVYDAASNRLMIVFGGCGPAPLGCFFDEQLWVLENANGLGGTPNWTQFVPAGDIPHVRGPLEVVYDPTSNRIMLFGGSTSTGRTNNVWVLSNANGTEASAPAWTQLSPNGVAPIGRDANSVVYNPATNRMTVFGGRVFGGSCPGSCTTLNDVWVLTDVNTGAFITSIVEVDIDITPGSNPNSINPRSKGKISVAILTSDVFDATSVDETTVYFGATGTEASPVKVALEDVDGDLDTDMILHFKTQDTGLLCGDIEAILTGKTLGGLAIEGSESVRTVGCK